MEKGRPNLVWVVSGRLPWGKWCLSWDLKEKLELWKRRQHVRGGTFQIEETMFGKSEELWKYRVSLEYRTPGEIHWSDLSLVPLASTLHLFVASEVFHSGTNVLGFCLNKGDVRLLLTAIILDRSHHYKCD